MPKNKRVCGLPDDWFFEMAAASYADSLFQEFKSQPDFPADDEEKDACERIWKRIQKRMPGTFLMAGWQKARPVCLKIGKIAAAVIITAAVTFSTAFITVEAFRVKVLEMVYKQNPSYTEITVTTNKPWTKNIYAPTAIPPGYKVLEETKKSPMHVILYTNSDGNIIRFVQSPLGGGGNYNTENGTIETVVVSGQEYLLVEVPGERSIIWHNDEALFNLWCRVPQTATTGQDTEGPLSLEELVDIANSLEMLE